MHGKAHGGVGASIGAADGPSAHHPAHLAGVVSFSAILTHRGLGADGSAIAATTYIAPSNLMERVHG